LNHQLCLSERTSTMRPDFNRTSHKQKIKNLSHLSS